MQLFRINLDNIKSICYWSNLLKNQNNDMNNKYNKSNDAQREEFKIRCANSKGDELSDMKVFIDTEIKFLESIIINIQIILKRDSFNERKEIIKRLKRQRNEQRILQIRHQACWSEHPRP